MLRLLTMMILLLTCGLSLSCGYSLGLPCNVDRECPSPLRCYTEAEFKGGVCLLPCNDDRDCPSDKACIDTKGGVCLPTCLNNTCPTGYACSNEKNKGGGASAICLYDGGTSLPGALASACNNDAQCVASFECYEGKDFPDGHCTRTCTSDADCPPGGACVDKEKGICMLTCTRDQDCRRDYSCKGHERITKDGEVLVCKK